MIGCLAPARLHLLPLLLTATLPDVYVPAGSCQLLLLLPLSLSLTRRAVEEILV